AVEAAEAGERFVHEMLAIGGCCNVGLNGDRLAARLCDFADDFVGGLAIGMVVDRHGVSVVGQAHCDRAANAAGRAGDKSDWMAIHNLLVNLMQSPSSIKLCGNEE